MSFYHLEKKIGKPYRFLCPILVILILVTGVHMVWAVPVGPYLVRDIRPGALYSSPDSLTDVDGVLFFIANNGSSGRELYRSDGTAGGTVLVKDINPGEQTSGPKYLTSVDGVLFFHADDDEHGRELWRSDGTAAGTVLVKDIMPGRYSSLSEELTQVNGEIFFAADDGDSGYELYKSDGTAAGTSLVKDIQPGAGGAQPGNLTDVNGLLFFHADNDRTGDELYKSDGTITGTVVVKDIVNKTGSSAPRALTNVGGTLFFSADDGVYGRELYKSDGTTAGTVMVKDINPGEDSSNLSSLTDVGGVLFFIADDGSSGKELYKSDGTAAGTARVRDINPGSGSSLLDYMTNVDGTLFFSADSGDGIERLYKSDGTEAGTGPITQDISFPSDLTNVGGTPFGGAHGVLFFSAYEVDSGYELYKSDGTEAGTVRVANISPGNSSSLPSGLTSVDTPFGGAHDALFFSARGDSSGFELWALYIVPNLTLAKTVTPITYVPPGAQVTYRLSYDNNGYSTASGIVITDLLPLGLTHVSLASSGATITRTDGVTYAWQVDDLAPGEGGEIRIIATVDPEFPDGILVNTATIASASAEASASDNVSSAEVTVRSPALRVSKSVQGEDGAPTNLPLNGVAIYTIVLDNSLDEVAAGVVMTDPLPARVSFGGWVEQGLAQLLPSAGTGTLAREIITWGPHDIPAHDVVSIVFSATIASGSTALAGGEVINTAWFNSADAGSGLDSAVFTIKFMDLFLPLLTKKQI